MYYFFVYMREAASFRLSGKTIKPRPMSMAFSWANEVLSGLATLESSVSRSRVVDSGAYEQSIGF